MIANIILFVHSCMFLFLSLFPFFSSNLHWSQIHILCLFCVLIHWLLNDNTCVLTIMEKQARELAGESVDYDETFFSKIFNPVYAIPDNLTVYLFIQFTLLCSINHMKLTSKC